MRDVSIRPRCDRHHGPAGWGFDAPVACPLVCSTRPPSAVTDETRLADAVRELARTVHAVSADRESLDRAVAHVEAATAALAAGERRLRWYELDPGAGRGARTPTRALSAFSGDINPVAPPMTIVAGELAGGRSGVTGHVRLDRLREGPPRSAHGGVVAGLFDELLGVAQRLAGNAEAVTGRLTVRYRLPTPIDTELRLEAWVHERRGRRVLARARCLADEVVTAEAEALFVALDPGRPGREAKGGG